MATVAGWTTRVRRVSSTVGVRPVVTTALLAVAILVITVNLALGGWLVGVDEAVGTLGARESFRSPVPFADWADRIGQRTFCLPLLGLLVYVIWRRYGFRRPIVIAVVGNLGLNFVIGVLKLATGRQSPRGGSAEFFTGDLLYPSGHSANVVFVYGLMAAFALRYSLVHPRRRRLLVTGVTAVTVLMFGISIYRDTHWLTDLVVGAMLGGIALVLALVADRQWPWIRSTAERILVATLRLVAPLRSWDLESDIIRRSRTDRPASHRAATTSVGGVLDYVGPRAGSRQARHAKRHGSPTGNVPAD